METMARVLGLDLEPTQLRLSHIALRTVILFFAMLLMMRLAGLRFLAGRTTFDVLFGFILASMLSRAINGPAPFWGTIFAGFLVVGLHRLLAWATYKSHRLGCWLKGEPQPVILDGQMVPETMARHCLSDRDLSADLRLKASVDSPARVKAAYIERNGEISVQCQPTEKNPATAEQAKHQEVQSSL